MRFGIDIAAAHTPGNNGIGLIIQPREHRAQLDGIGRADMVGQPQAEHIIPVALALPFQDHCPRCGEQLRGYRRQVLEGVNDLRGEIEGQQNNFLALFPGLVRPFQHRHNHPDEGLGGLLDRGLEKRLQTGGAVWGEHPEQPFDLFLADISIGQSFQNLKHLVGPIEQTVVKGSAGFAVFCHRDHLFILVILSRKA